MFRQRTILTAILFFALVALSACDLIPLEPLPTPVEPLPTTAPSTGVIAGRVWQDLLNTDGVPQANEPGLAGVTVGLGLACPASTVLASTDANGNFSFRGVPAGTFCITVDPTRPENAPLLTGRWTQPSAEQPNSAVNRIITLAAGETKDGVNFGRDTRWSASTPTFTPAPPTSTATPTITPIPPTATPTACLDRINFVADITVPDRSNIAPGTSFVKTWRLQNAGTCLWDGGYALAFAGGNSMQGQTIVALATVVPPGGTVDVSVTLVAPAVNGQHRGEWKLRNANGVLFGLGPNADLPFWVQIEVGPTPTPTATRTPTPPAIRNWRGEYFNNRDFAGSPVLVRDDVAPNSPGLEFDWQGGAPATGLPADNFAVRWMRNYDFAAGTYRFRVLADDGVRVWVDNQLVIDDWRDGGASEITAEVGLAAGTHSLRVDFYEAGGLASLQFGWTPMGTPSYPDWKGEYWANRTFNGAPVLARNDRAIDFDWGTNAPTVGVPADDFAVRWSRWVTFEPGLYRFSARADDGIRVYVDGRPVIDQWIESDGSRTYTAEVNLSGPRAVMVEYFERGGKALVKVNWEKLPPTATPTVTATPTATATQPPPPVIASFTISPTTVRRGQPVTLTWNVTGADSVTLWRLDDKGRFAEPSGLAVPASGSQVMDPADPLNQYYSFYLYATRGQAAASASVKASICEGDSCPQ